jgi:transcriptional regulator with XRE-family HTH domain
MSKSLHSQRYRLFRELLLAERERAGLTQVEVARLLRKPQSFVSKYERGDRRLDMTEFLELADALVVDVPAFLERYRIQISPLERLPS